MREERPPLINQQSTGSLFKRGLCDASYRIYSAKSRDPKICTCRLDITKTKNKSKTPGFKPRPIHYYKTELLITGEHNIFWKNYINCHKWGLDDGDL